MANRALLIGSQTEGLLGTNNDVEAMGALLETRGFCITRRLDDEATRQGILEAYKNLITQTKPDDCVLIYYSGHGARAKNPEYNENHPAKSPAYYQFIVPTDIYDSTDTDFRGITTHELSSLLAQLTSQTRNVTVILDCCHAALMSRGPEYFVPKALRRDWYGGISSHLDQLRSQGIDVSGRSPGNPYAVGIVACGPNESAYEYGSSTGRRMGILTESLCIALEEVGQLEHVDWRSVEVRIRNRSQGVFPAQRPMIEGPAGRVVFGLREVDHAGVLSVVRHGKEAILEGGRIFGINIGDQYAIMPMGSAKADSGKKIATATVQAVGGASSKLQIDLNQGHYELPETALAFPIAKAAKRFPVRVEMEDTGGLELRQAIVANTQLDLVEDSSRAEITTVRILGGTIKLYDNTNVLLFEEKPNDQNGITDTIANLCTLGKAEALRNLKGGEGPSRLNVPVEITWGRIEGGSEHPLSFQGDILYVGESVFIRVINRGTRHVWVSLFDIGLAGKRTLVNGNLAPLGVELAPNDDYTVGMKDGVLQGLALTWPSGLPQDQPRPESVIIMVMDRPHDLRPLQGAGMRPGIRGQRSPLQRLFDQVDTGQTRDIGEEGPEADLRYDVHHINFFVDPASAPVLSMCPFLINETPDRSVLSWVSKRSPGSVRRPVSIHLTDLGVHKKHAFSAAPIRIDSMVISKTVAMDNPARWQQTFRFLQSQDGDSLQLGKCMIYIGDVEDFVTLGIWISRDMPGSPEFAKLFEARLGSDKFQTATMGRGDLALVESQAAFGVGTISAASRLLTLGYQLLSETLPDSICLYTNSFVHSDGFGVGSHPPKGMLSAQDLSLRYVILDESEGDTK